MSTPPWLQAQRSQQQQQLFCLRSATPPPSRPRSAAAPSSPSPLGGRHVIPRSRSALHSRPPSAPRLCLLDPPPQSIVENPQAGPYAPQPPQRQGGVAIGSPVHIDYSAIQRIADGVERMVRSWKSENSCRAQVYAKAYDSLHAAMARGKDQVASADVVQVTENSSSCTEPAPLKLNPHSDNMSAQLLDLHNLQSPADPNSVEMSPCIFDMRQHHRTIDSSNLIVDTDPHISQTYQESQEYDGETSHAGTSRNSVLMDNVDLLYAEGPPFAVSEDAAKKRKIVEDELCMHNRTHRYPIGLGLIREDDDMERKSGEPSIAGVTAATRHQPDNTWVKFQSQQQTARSQHVRGYQNGEPGEPGAPFELPQQFQMSNQSQNMPLPRKIDLVNLNSLLTLNLRSKSPPLRLGGVLAHCNAGNSLDVYREGSKPDRKFDDKYEKKVKELEISLLECATEYEVQLVEMKMKMLQMKSEFRQKIAPEDTKLALCKPLQSPPQEYLINTKPSGQANSSNELPVEPLVEPNNFKRRTNREKHLGNVSTPNPKPRGEAIQRKSSLEDQDKIVTCLQKLLSRKEQELLNSKLREKELAGQNRELQTLVQRGRSAKVEPKKLLSLLLALSEWLQLVKAGVINDDGNTHRRAYQNVHALAHLRINPEEPPQNANRTSNNQSPRLENLATIVNKEIKTLQEKLGKLTHHKRRIK